MKFKEFIPQVEALGFHVEVTTYRGLVLHLEVIDKAGNLIACIDGWYAFNYSFFDDWRPETAKYSYEVHRCLVLLVQQLADTEIKNRGLLPNGVAENHFDEIWKQRVTVL